MIDNELIVNFYSYFILNIIFLIVIFGGLKIFDYLIATLIKSIK